MGESLIRINPPVTTTSIGAVAKGDLVLNVKDYGAKGDGTTDDTTAIQAFITDVVVGQQRGYVPKGVYKITSTLNVPCRPNWRIEGAGSGSTTLLQATDNTPILNMGSDAASFMHTWALTGIFFDYVNVQPAANTSANPILFSQMGFEALLEDLVFNRGSYAIRVASGIGCPWGTTWDNLRFEGGLTLGAMNWSAGANAVPNNSFGRFKVQCDNMAGPIFNIRGYNFTIDTIEFLNATNAQLMTFAGGSQVTIGALKLEVGTFTATTNLFEFLQDASAHIGQISVAGTTMAVTSPAVLTVLKAGAGGNGASAQGGRVIADRIVANASSVTGAAYLAFTARPHTMEIGSVSMSGGFVLQNTGSTLTGDALIVRSWLNDQVTQDRGDADYTVATTDTNINRFGTAFTAARTITLPNADLHNGLYYEFIFDGAINGSNTAAIKVAGTTLKTVTADKSVVRYTWRRSAALGTGAWVLTKNTGLADTTPQTTDGTQARGDVAVTLTTSDKRYQHFNTTLTANRTVTLPNTGVQDGMEFEVMRTGAGAFALTVSDPLSGKSYVFGPNVKGFVRYRAVATNEWVIVSAGTFAGSYSPSSAVRAMSGTGSILATDATVLATTGASAITLTLPAVASGQRVSVMKADSGAGTVTISPASGTITGATTLSSQGDGATYVSDGTNWFQVK